MQFVCRYGTPDGRVLTAVRPGADLEAVRRELEREGLHIFEVRPRGGLLAFAPAALPRGRGRRIAGEEFLAFNQELAALLKAGLPLLQALDLMLERMENPTLKHVLSEVRDRVSSGSELSDAFAGFGDLFPPIYSATLRAGERSGELETVLRRFIRYLRLLLAARKRVTSALVYPAVLILAAVTMILVLTIYVLPQFRDFYADLDAELPTITQITLGVSFWLRHNLVWLLLALVAGIVALRLWLRTERGRHAVDQLRLRLPLLGPIFHGFALSELCRSLSTLIAGGIPLLSALDTAIDAVGNSWVRAELRPAVTAVREGQSFHASLERTGVVPPMAVDMVKVGEATGSLDEMLANVADYFDEKVEVRMSRLLALVEPVLLIFMGVVIATLLISIYMPMFGAFSQIQ